jgi:ATP-binding cassette subfamily B protein
VTTTATKEGWRLLRSTLKAQRAGLTIGVLVGLVWTGSKVVVPMLVQQAIDRSITTNEDPLWWWVVGILLAGVFAGVFMALRRYYAFRESRWSETWLRERLFAHIQQLHVGYHDHAQTGQLMSRASTDLLQVQMFVVMIPLTLSNFALVAAVVIVLVRLNPFLALLALGPLPFLNMIARRFSTTIHPVVMDVQQEAAQVATVVEETVAGVRVVKGFGAEPVQAAKLRTEADDVRRVSLEAARVRSVYIPLMDILPSIGLVLVLAFGGHQVINGQMTLGELVAFNSYVALLIWPLRALGMTVASMQRAAAALERVHEVLSTEPIVTDPPHALSLPDVQPAGHVRFDDVAFGYDPERRVLDGFRLDLAAGSSVAIVGATASGKSTVARLLARFYDVQQGAITIDGIDLRHLKLHDLRSNVGIVFEDTFLFHDTVAANIAFAVPDAPFEEIERAARLAGAHDFIGQLPDGYGTLLGERGFSLSGGQRQRIAIARAILADPRVLVLDDATSAVDPSKEHEIRDALTTVLRGRTTIVIAHRAATIALADTVVLLDEGRVAATGTHEGLLATNERYREVLAAYAANDAEVAEVGDGDLVDVDTQAVR